MVKEIKKIAERYEFMAEIVKKKASSNYGSMEFVIIKARNTDGKLINWLSIFPQDKIVAGNNTDQCNIWLYLTRPDLSADDLVKLFSEIEDALGFEGNDRELLRTYVNPEDWQEIAKVPDAHEDFRYIGVKLCWQCQYSYYNQDEGVHKCRLLDEEIKNCNLCFDYLSENCPNLTEEQRRYLGFPQSRYKSYTWKDIVEIKGKHYAEEFPISGKTDEDSDGNVYYQLDEFFLAVSKKYGVEEGDILTYMMDNIAFDPQNLPYGAEDCGCYINGVPEWTIITRRCVYGRRLTLKAINIQWDKDGADVDLPDEIEIPEGMTDEDEISDYLSDKTGFCHLGYELVKE